jgi:hypothetical protein
MGNKTATAAAAASDDPREADRQAYAKQKAAEQKRAQQLQEAEEDKFVKSFPGLSALVPTKQQRASFEQDVIAQRWDAPEPPPRSGRFVLLSESVGGPDIPSKQHTVVEVVVPRWAGATARAITSFGLSGSGARFRLWHETEAGQRYAERTREDKSDTRRRLEFRVTARRRLALNQQLSKLSHYEEMVSVICVACCVFARVLVNNDGVELFLSTNAHRDFAAGSQKRFVDNRRWRRGRGLRRSC